MKTAVLITAALVFPLIWGYLSEQLLKRVWPKQTETSSEAGAPAKDEPKTFSPDYQI